MYNVTTEWYLECEIRATVCVTVWVLTEWFSGVCVRACARVCVVVFMG